MLSFLVLCLEIVVLIIGRALGNIEINSVFSSFLIGVYSLSFFVSVQRSFTLSKYSDQIALGYLARVALLFIDIFCTKIITLPQSGDDSAMFFRTSSELVLYGNTNRSGNFIDLMAFVFNTLGISKLYGQFLLMLLSVLAIDITIRIIDSLDIEEDIKELVSWIICLLPNFALLSSLFLRESIVTLLITISICNITIWISKGNSFSYIIAIISSIIACMFHSGSVGIVIGCVFCLLIYDSYERRIHISIWGGLLAAAVAIGISFIFLQNGEELMVKFLNVGSIEDIANTNKFGGSSYARYVGNSNNIFNMIIYTIPRIVYFLFSPFPWQWRGIGDIIAFFFSGMFYLITVASVYSYLRRGEHSNRTLVVCLLIIAFFCTLIFAWGVSNTGTASRHRDKMVCLYALILAITLSKEKEKTPTDSFSVYIKKNK